MTGIPMEIDWVFWLNLKHFTNSLFHKNRISPILSAFSMIFFHPLTKGEKMDILFK